MSAPVCQECAATVPLPDLGDEGLPICAACGGNMTNGAYAFEFAGHGTFTPDGRADGRADSVTDVVAHNARVEQDELALWATKPERWQVYVVGTVSHAGQPYRATNCDVQRGDKVTTWLGSVLGTITYASTFAHNFGSRMTCIRFKGTNGATYSGRFGSDWAQLCRVRKVGGGK